METWRSACGTYAVVLDARFLDEAGRLAREHYPSEVGTALVGKYSDDGWQATVLELAPLTTDSDGGASWFIRGARGLRSHFARLFSATRGLTHYVGEWHSHPDGAPIPSPTDDRNMMDIARDPHAQCPECVLVLIGLGDEGTQRAVYVYSRDRGRIDLNQES